MSDEEVQYAEFVDRRVILTKVDGSEHEGKISAVSPILIMFVPKGTRSGELVTVADVQDIQLRPEKPRKLSQKSMDPVTTGRVRRHLLDYHGTTLAEVNGMGDVEAEIFHDAIDHSDLGHNHDGRPVKASEGDDSDGEAE